MSHDPKKYQKLCLKLYNKIPIEKFEWIIVVKKRVILDRPIKVNSGPVNSTLEHYRAGCKLNRTVQLFT